MQFTARLLKSVEQRQEDDVFLVGTQHLDLNDEQVKDEIERISPKLIPAVTRDIADKGDAIAENIDSEISNDAACQLMTLLLASSLSRAVGGRIGLSESEIIEFLAAPNRKADEFLDALQKLREQAWYLHREDQRFYIKETENLSRQIERNAKEIPQPKIDQALINRLKGILQPTRRNVYQEVQILPRIDELKLSGPRVLIVIKPDGKVPPSELINFFEYQQEKNNLLVLTGQDSMMADAVEDRLRELYAIEQIVKRLKGGDTLFEEARDRLEEAEGRFIKALSASYNTILFPGIDDIDGSDRLLKVTIDHGLKVGEGDQSAEVQIEKLMADPRANYKLASDLKDDFGQYFSMAESELWPSGANNRRTPWKDIVNRAKCNPGWPWMPGSSGMDTLRTEALKQGRWRMGEDGYIEKGPFPKEKTSVNVTLISTNPETGESLLTLTPRNAGESPVIYFSTKSEVFDSDPQVLDLENFSTLEGTLYFKVVDPTGKYECGPATRWVAELKIRHQIEPSADMRKVTLQCSPKAEMYYTLDGSNPKDGQLYTVPFEVGTESARLLIYAKSGEATKTADFQIPNSGDKTIQIDDVKPARLSSSKRVPLDTTEKVFTIINRFKDQMNTRFKGVRIEIGEGENTVRINFGVRYVTAAMIEASVNSLREVLSEADANVAIKITDGIAFENGFEAREFAKLVGIELKPGDIAQEE
ncbi:TPA: FN3 associated domain-containing protein [Klebsiella pneumoniae]